MYDGFGLDLILGEERSRPRSEDIDGDGEPDDYLSDTPPTAKQSVVIERKDFTATAPFVVGDDVRSFPLYGVGCVESLLLVTEEDAYSITVETDTTSGNAGEDESAFIDAEDYSVLKTFSTELSSVAAYENANGDNVLDVGPVSFLDSVRVAVDPDDSLSVIRQRAEVTLERSVQRP